MMKHAVVILLALSACQPTSNTLPPVSNGAAEPEQTVATEVAVQTAEPEKPDIEGLEADQERVVADATTLDARLTQTPGRLVALENFAAEGAMAWSWRDADGKVIKAVVESKGETYDSVDSLYFKGGEPVFARRFYFSNPAKFDEAGSETYADSIAARSAESTLFFFKEGKVAAVSSTGSRPANQEAELDPDSRLVEWPITALKALDPEGEEFSTAVASIQETLAAALK
jgi:hypothetical protein